MATKKRFEPVSTLPNVAEQYTEDWQEGAPPSARDIASRVENTAETGRRVHLKDRSTGAIVNIDERDLGRTLQSGAFEVASDDEVSKERDDKKGKSLSEQASGALTAFQVNFSKGAWDAATILPRAAIAAGVDLAGGDGTEVFEETSGAKLIENVAYIGSEALGISGEKGARVAKEQQQRLDREHGTASTVGRVAGQVAGTVVGGVGKLGVSAATSVAARTGSRALGLGAAGAIEGAALGAGDAAETAYIADEELTGEKILASTAMGGLLGAGGGFLVAGAGGLAQKAARRLMRGTSEFDMALQRDLATATVRAEGAITETVDTLSGVYNRGVKHVGDALDMAQPIVAPKGLAATVRDFARGRAIKALGFQKNDLRRIAPKGANAAQIERKISQIADEAEGLLSKTGDLEETAANVAKAHRLAGEKLGAIRDKVDDAIKSGISKKVNSPQEFVESALGFAPTRQALIDDIGEQVFYPLLDHPDQLVRNKSTQIVEVIEDLHRLGENPTTAELIKFKNSLWENRINEKTMGLVQAKLGTEHLQKTAGIIDNHVSAAVEKFAAEKGLIDEYMKAKLTYHALGKANVALGKATAGQAGNRFHSLSDYIVGGATFGADLASGGIASTAKGLATGTVHKVARERGSAIMANAAFRLARHLDNSVDKSLRTFFQKAAGEWKPRRVRLGGGAGVASGGGAEQAISRQPRPTAARGTTAAIAAAAGMSPAMAMFMGDEKKPQKAYRKRVNEIHKAAENVGGGVRRALPKEFAALGETHPKLYTHLGVKATTAVGFLKSKLPAPLMDIRSMTPRSSRPIPSSVEMAEFARYYNTVMDPTTALDDLIRGQLTSEQVEALQVVYPRMYQKLQLKTVEMIAQHDKAGKPLPFHQRGQLALLLDLGDAGDPLLSSDFGLKVQDAAEQVRSQRQQNTPKPPGSGGEEKVERLKPRSQEL